MPFTTRLILSLVLAVVLTAVVTLLPFFGSAIGGDRTPSACVAPSAAVEVVSAQFGFSIVNPDGSRSFVESAVVPGLVQQSFGWVVIFRTDQPVVVVREEFELPEAPPTWGPGEVMGVFEVMPDRRTAVTQYHQPTRLGIAANRWLFAPGDPTGPHAMRVYINGVLIRDFRFRIEAPPEAVKPTKRA